MIHNWILIITCYCNCETNFPISVADPGEQPRITLGACLHVVCLWPSGCPSVVLEKWFRCWFGCVLPVVQDLVGIFTHRPWLHVTRWVVLRGCIAGNYFVVVPRAVVWLDLYKSACGCHVVCTFTEGTYALGTFVFQVHLMNVNTRNVHFVLTFTL